MTASIRIPRRCRKHRRRATTATALLFAASATSAQSTTDAVIGVEGRTKVVSPSTTTVHHRSAIRTTSHAQHNRQQHRRQIVEGQLRQQQQRQLGKKKKQGGAYNPNLVAYDPNSPEYQHGNPALGSFTQAKIDNTAGSGSSSGSEANKQQSASWSPCPADTNFEGNRASHDCLSYIYCAGGQIRGSYDSCMGLKFDNTRGVCDWAESVVCDVHSGSNGEEGGGGESLETGSDGGSSSVGQHYEDKMIGSATEIAVAQSQTAGSSGATAVDAANGWSNSGSDWGGSWINNVWVPDGEKAQSPATSPGSNANHNIPAWQSIEWGKILPYPPHPILPSHTSSNDTVTLPREYISPEGWSASSRSKPDNGTPKKVVGYYAAWQWYDNAERASPGNMEFSKMDRVNFAFFQIDEEGHVWGTDSWADPITLFGPHDWSVDVPPNSGYAPQFYDDNGFDDSFGHDWNYVGKSYVDAGSKVYCHRPTPTGKRDCNGHSGKEGLIGRAHEQGALVYPSIGGWSLSDVFPALSKSAEARRNFAKNCVGLIREYNFDGIDIDWEFPGYEPQGGTPQDRQNFVLLLQDIRSALDAYTKATYPDGSRTFGLTAALPCGPPIIDDQDVLRVSEILTELNLMTYDFHTTWDKVVGVNAPLNDQPEDKFFSPEYSVIGCVDRWVREGADKSKINIGLPFYGRSYSGATELYADFDGADGMNWWADMGQPQYYNILDKLPDMISRRDDVTKTQYAYFEEGGVISFDDSQAICDKVEYARENELHGFIIWDLSGDLTEDLRTPLLDVVNFKLDQGDAIGCELFKLETRDESGQVMGTDENGKPHVWYANWETGTCINDGKHPAWETEDNLFRFKEECCAHRFEYKFDVCVGPPTESPTKEPTKGPTPAPIITDSPTDNPTHIFGAAKVIGDGDSLSPTKEPMKGPTPSPTMEPTEAPTPSPTMEPTEAPTPSPSKEPMEAPTSAPITTDSPTDNPTHIFGAAKIIGIGDSPSPISRLTQGSEPGPPITWCFGGCKGAGEKCVGNQNNPQSIDDNACRNCQSGQTFWPCDVDGLCFCWDPSTPRIPPAPSSGLAQLSQERPCSYFTKATYDLLAPQAQYPYTYDGLCKAIDNYNEGHAEKIFMMGTEFDRKSEMASFLGHTLHESDEWKASREYLMCADSKVVGSETYCKPCDSGSFNWETFKCDGVGLAGGGLTFNGYCDRTIEPPGACTCDDTLKSEPAPLEGYIPASKVFFGRGAIQLSWNYNFRAASEALTGDPLKFCDNPDLVATTPEYAWGAGVFFWMENLKEETTCHIEALRDHDFGGTLNNINGGLECPAYHGGWHGEAIKLRINRYCKASYALGLDSILVFDGCKGLADSYAECLADGTCPDCLAYQGSEGVIPVPGPVPDWSEPIPEPVAAPDPIPNPTPNPTPQPVEIQLDVFTCSGDTKLVPGLPECCVLEPAYHGDGACDTDSPYNTAACAFDGGDCCRETCDLDSTYGCKSNEFGPFGYFCINPDLEEYINPDECAVSDRTKIGDGRCDEGVEMYNTAGCNWDGGDCCEGTCHSEYVQFVCGEEKPFECRNPDYLSKPTYPPSAQPIETEYTYHPTKYPTPSPVESNSKPDAPPPALVTVVVSEDATIVKGFPDSNLGRDSELKVKGLSSGPNAHDSMLRFVIPASGFSSSIYVQAVLNMYSLVDAPTGGIFHIAPETDGSWRETDVTWNTAPAWDTRIGSIGGIERDQWYEIDVSDVIASLNGKEGAISIRIRSRDSQIAKYSSKQGEHPPEIMVAYGSLNSDLPFGEDPPQVDSKLDVVVIPEPTSNPTPYPTPTPTKKPITPRPTPRPTRHPIRTATTTTSTVASDLGLHVLIPSDDATIVQERPGENFGSDHSLQVDDDSGVYDFLIRFDIPDGIDTRYIESATLRLYCTDGSNSGGIIGKTHSTDWYEADVTWGSAPQGSGAPIHSMGMVQKATWYDIDVIDLFTTGNAGNTNLNAVSMRVTSNSWNRAGYSSKEGSEPPQLVIQMKSEFYSMEAKSDSGVQVCAQDVRRCSDGSYVSRNHDNGCSFRPCPDSPQIPMDSPSSGTGLFFPEWRENGAIGCLGDFTSSPAPSWARGAYLKESKSACCKAFFMLQVEECLAS